MSGHRRSIRLKNYDCTQAGAYFVTICTAARSCLFGRVVDGEMELSPGGQMVQQVWSDLPTFYSGVEVDEFVVMPNHVHGIVVETGVETGEVGDQGREIAAWDRRCGARGQGQARRPAPTSEGTSKAISFGEVVGRFKSYTTTQFRKGMRTEGWLPFSGALWQRNFFERVIRDEGELARAREYIAQNALKWELDRENPGYAL